MTDWDEKCEKMNIIMPWCKKATRKKICSAVPYWEKTDWNLWLCDIFQMMNDNDRVLIFACGIKDMTWYKLMGMGLWVVQSHIMHFIIMKNMQENKLPIQPHSFFCIFG